MDDPQRGRSLFRHGKVDQKAAVACDLVLEGTRKNRKLKDMLWRTDADAAAFANDRDRHKHRVRRDVKELAAISRPSRARAAVGGHWLAGGTIRKRLDVDLRWPAGVARLVRDPLAVG